MSKKLIPMAICYDFDGTLSPNNMQDYEFMHRIGQNPTKFWSESNNLAKEKIEMKNHLTFVINSQSDKKEQTSVGLFDTSVKATISKPGDNEILKISFNGLLTKEFSSNQIDETINTFCDLTSL